MSLGDKEVNAFDKLFLPTRDHKKKSFTLNCSDKTGSFSAVCVNPTGSIKVVTVSDNLHLLRWPFTVPFKFIMKNVSLSLCSFSASYPLT